VHDAEQVNGPRFDELSAALFGDLAGFHRQTECIFGVSTEVRQAGQAIERLRLTDSVAVGSRDNSSAQGVLTRCYRVDLLLRGGAFEQLTDCFGRARFCGREGIRIHELLSARSEADLKGS